MTELNFEFDLVVLLEYNVSRKTSKRAAQLIRYMKMKKSYSSLISYVLFIIKYDFACFT